MDRKRFGIERNVATKGFDTKGKGAAEPKATNGDKGAAGKAGQEVQNQAMSVGEGSGRSNPKGAPRNHEGRSRGRTSKKPPVLAKEE